MTKLTTLARAFALAATLLAGGLSTAPAFAAAADIALLKEYLGDWKGRGTLSGANTETVVCRMSLKDGNQDKVTYSGRCTLAGTQLSINGTIAFVDASNRYEAVMTSNATFTGTAVGRKKGKTIVFDLKEREKDEDGNEMDITASLVLAGGQIDVRFQVVFTETGDMLRAAVPFRK